MDIFRLSRCHLDKDLRAVMFRVIIAQHRATHLPKTMRSHVVVVVPMLVHHAHRVVVVNAQAVTTAVGHHVDRVHVRENVKVTANLPVVLAVHLVRHSVLTHVVVNAPTHAKPSV